MKGIDLTGGRCTHAGDHQPEPTARDYRQQHYADEEDTGEVVNFQGIGAEVGGISPFSDRETKCGQPGTAGERLVGGVLGGDDTLIRDARPTQKYMKRNLQITPFGPGMLENQARLLVAHRYGGCLITAGERREADDPTAVINKSMTLESMI